MIAMSVFHLKIVTPDAVKYDGMAQKVIVRTVAGDMCVLAGHIDYAAPLAIGVAKVSDEQGEERLAACNSGFIAVSNGEVCIASTTFEWSEEIDRDRAEASKEKSEKALQECGEDKKEYASADVHLRRALARLNVLNR